MWVSDCKGKLVWEGTRLCFEFLYERDSTVYRECSTVHTLVAMPLDGCTLHPSVNAQEEAVFWAFFLFETMMPLSVSVTYRRDTQSSLHSVVQHTGV